jgi:sec-independent protein translocase protein TatC
VTETPDAASPWTPHLEELRGRIVAVLIVFLTAVVVAFHFSSHIAAFLTDPLAIFGVKLYTFAPAEKFMAYLRLSVWTGALCAVPYLCVQAGLFLWPGLRGREHVCTVAVLFAVPVFFILGAALCYRFLAPLVFGFFLSFGALDGIEGLWSFGEYLSLLFDLMIATGLLLQIPLFLFVLLTLGFVSPERVARFRPYVILLIFFLAAVLTPPDVISQVMLGVPLYLLFEGAFFLGRVLRKKK